MAPAVGAFADRFDPVPRAAGRETQENIDSVIEGFATSARHAMEAGCDGVEIHAAHSQLLGAFISPAFNHRSDGYGGLSRSRCRMVLEVGERVRAAVGGKLASGCACPWKSGWPMAPASPKKNSCASSKSLDASGFFDFYDLSAGGYFAKHVSVTPMTSDLPQGFLAPYAARARASIKSGARIFVVGRILDIAVAARIVDSGRRHGGHDAGPAC